MIIINSPHNPSGVMFSQNDMLELSRILKDTNILLISDEVYEHIIFDKNNHQSVAKFKPLRERAFITASFGKTFHTTGWKTGYCLAPKQLMTEFRKIHQFNVFCTNHPIQYALAKFLKTKENYTQLPDFYQQKRDLFLSLIKDSKFRFTPSAGTYFQLLDYSQITNEKDIEFAKRLTIDYQIASIPISVFNLDQRDDHLLRFCFAKTEDTLKQAAEFSARYDSSAARTRTLQLEDHNNPVSH